MISLFFESVRSIIRHDLDGPMRMVQRAAVLCDEVTGHSGHSL
ncbi:hypothetical protein [Ruania albidiflava]|nr:hypothetical protein [Ruania albidiflava]